MAKKKKTYDDDDGRVIANMNVDGMPWYARSKPREETPKNNDFSDLTKGETREIIKGTLKAALLIGGAFMLGLLLFILFCVYIWF